MNIETLQIKRVTGNWNDYQSDGTNVDGHKKFVPNVGEPVLISVGVVPGVAYPMLVIGDGTNTLETLVNDNKVFIEKDTVDTLITTNDAAKLATDKPADIDTTADVGTSQKVARADHKHKIEKSTITKVLKDDNNFEYHGIKFSTSAPTKDTPGNIGDIIIVYEDK